MMAPMHERIRDDLLIRERALWTALTSADPGPAVEKLCNPDANMIFPKMPILTLDTEPSLSKALQPPFHRFDQYSLSEVRVIIIDLMAGTVTYRIHASRGEREYRAIGSTTWSQASDGEWRIVCHQETR
ncbi:hypothetical protein ASPWEDRAFT_52113 [Aspergillus wentii DTO 134E9]|uniref:DUF4440 domain-containing protein n=1 Tax=Aspergillus wentii DTO 134E9 TaxID=1073089 RepID=A0A1L9RFM9_ASPWE|nr:uncharacterized protein ASPWEDRAFT_52113 [Aspergillus wentii DTO 134E9]OJJ33678.1 hypothetical protein ASPWEDRAFT_52113 [Aspergillus wentii DTO 134E9]